MSTQSESIAQAPITQEPITRIESGSIVTAHTAAAAELAHGLLADAAFVSPKYLYDTLGSKLFEALCLLPEYYPTRTEDAIIGTHMGDIREAIGTGATLIDLGAGNCAKAARLFPALAPRHYVPIDISKEFLVHAAAQLQRRYPQMHITALGLDFSQELVLPSSIPAERRVFFYPGSSIGNFSRAQASMFLRRIRAACDDDGSVLIGIDLIKDAAMLQAAYDDALGLTAAFNLNLLRNVNRLLGSDFDVADWMHTAYFNQREQRVEMHLQARRPAVVRWPGGRRAFDEGSRIHTENSHKYTLPSFTRMLAEAGFEHASAWTDENDWFAVVHARAA